MSARDDFPRVAFHAQRMEGHPPDIFERDCIAVLDEIDSLRAEVERLKSENAELTRQRDAACLTRNLLHVENVRLTEEAMKLVDDPHAAYLNSIEPFVAGVTVEGTQQNE